MIYFLMRDPIPSIFYNVRMSPSEIEYYVQKRREGWDNSQVRKELQSEGYSEEEIFYCVNKIDDLFVNIKKDKSEFTVINFSNGLLELLIGLVILVIGLIATTMILLNGISILVLLIASIGTTTGYYFTKKGLQSLLAIRRESRRKINLRKEDDILDK